MPTIDYARTLGRPLRLDRVPTLVARTNGAPIAFGLLDSAAPHDAEPMPYDDAFLVCLPLRTASRRLRAGNTLLCDLTCTPQIYAEPPLRAIHAYLPYAALDALAYRAGRPRIQALRGEPGVGVDDATIRHLCLSLLPQFDAPERADPMLIDHVALALAGHVARTYGERRDTAAARGGLAPWQERRAKELLDAHLDGRIAVAELARQCGLSPSHFSRAFRRSTGDAPYAWLIRRRVDAAKALLRDRRLPLTQVALDCGFANQSHFTRAFKRQIGTSPGHWRRGTGD